MGDVLLFLLGYIGIGLIAGRLAYVALDSWEVNNDDNSFFALLVVGFWPLAAVMGVFGAVILGTHWVLTRPTPGQRRAGSRRPREASGRNAARHRWLT